MIRHIPLAVFLFLLLPACKKHVNSDALPRSGMPAAEARPTPEATTAPQALARNFERVGFDYDSARLTDPAKASLAENATILRENPGLRIEVQGHCDDRGTTEYNLALGDERAGVVRAYLTASGAAGSQVTTVSYGEERPLDLRTIEHAWAVNRRAEFRILAGEPGVAGTVD